MAYSTRTLSESESFSSRQLNRIRKKMKCLGCGREMVTDRCHRFCRNCLRRNRRAQFYMPKYGRIQGSLEL